MLCRSALILSSAVVLLRLAAIALLYLDQEDAFWCLIAIVEVFMPRDYYTKTLLGSQVSLVYASVSLGDGAMEGTRCSAVQR